MRHNLIAATGADPRKVREALRLLTDAKRLLSDAGAAHAAACTRTAADSAKGSLRHLKRRTFFQMTGDA